MGRPRATPADRPLPGRRPLDGSRALARLMREGKIDRRTAPAKALDQVVGVLAADWGGADQMTGAARLLADRIGVLTVRLMMREQRLIAEAAKGIDDPTSDKHTIALHNAFSRSLGRLEELRQRAGVAAGSSGTPCASCHGRFPDLQTYLDHVATCRAQQRPPVAAEGAAS